MQTVDFLNVTIKIAQVYVPKIILYTNEHSNTW